LAGGYIERADSQTDTLIYTNALDKSHLSNLDDLELCPTLFQHFLKKSADVRITIVDGRITTVSLTARESDGSQRCDIRRNNMEDVAYQLIDLPGPIRDKLMRLMGHYSLRFAAVDMVIDTEGKWYFLETNPNGQWAWLDQTGVTDIASSFIDAFSKPIE